MTEPRQLRNQLEAAVDLLNRFARCMKLIPVHLRFFGLHDLVIDTESFLLGYRESLNAETREQRLKRLGFEPVDSGYTVGDALGIPRTKA